MVAASRLKKAKHAVESSRPYSENIRQMAEDLASNISVKDSFSEKFPLLTGKGEDKSYMLLVLSSDRGLCGGLNSATVRFTKIRINNLVAEGKKVHLICVGKKAYEQLKGNYGNKIVDHIYDEDGPFFALTRAENYVSKFKKGIY